MRQLLWGFLSLLFFCTACDKSDETRIVEHPDYNLIPYAEYDYTLMSKNQDLSEFGSDLPRQVEILARFLESPNQIEATPVVLRNSWGAKAVSVDERLILLHIASDQLLEYDLSDSSITETAPFGRGPGDIAYANDLIKHNNKILLPRDDHKITVFDCDNEPCEYKISIPTDVSAKSLAVMNNDFAVMGTRYDGQIEKNITIYTAEGESVHSFGEYYQTNDFYLKNLLMQGTIRSSDLLNYYLIAYNRLPFLFIFNDDGDLIHKMRLETYNQTIHEYDTISRRVTTTPKGGISDLFQVDDTNFVISVTSYGNSSYDYDREVSFYLINLTEQTSYYIGTHHHQGDGNISIQLTDLGVVVIVGGEVNLFRNRN
ncbi:hypothetical protein DYD21_19820 [Rhodohalobacter sp. SW132]|uniref:hypothetical protein n=1 Tax=Rhodohalobacter sp. SW132 TaxID=2293433 RepID=UPI000E27172F|nr:hypothetical protein [Rhodohalobacter sp. SW132]REL24060.1 hypothetical protein DYD21_19820 [Rhodohalobacter sp. SW132]